ncbi:MAG: hypothetical protein AAF658_16620, partial [Myxococcota bacterium]
MRHLILLSALIACSESDPVSEPSPSTELPPPSDEPAECDPGFYGPDCIACACGSGSCDDGSTGSGACTCAPGTFGNDCAGTCACRVGALCADGASGDGTCTNDFQVLFSFDRSTAATPNPVAVELEVTNNGVPFPGAQIESSAARGMLSEIVDAGSGRYTAELTPEGTGEHPLTFTVEGTPYTRTPVVFPVVATDWAQPMKVEGLVNTQGYEDGATITPDGEYLFVQYGPLYFSGIFVFDLDRANGGCGEERLVPDRCEHPWINNTIGPFDAPERPGFFDGRIGSNGEWLHNANAWNVGVEQAPNFALSTMFYGFRRQPDGSFAEPFYLAFEDLNDGLISPFGLSFVLTENNTATLAFALNDPEDADQVDFDGNGSDDASSLTDIFTIDITLGENVTLGTYARAGSAIAPPVRSTPFPSTLVDFGKEGTEGIAGTQGNPHLHFINGVAHAVWTDDERDDDADTGELAVYVLESGTFPSSGVWSKTLLPSNINTP